MSYLINYINGVLFIHFSEMVQKANIVIFNAQKQEIKSLSVQQIDFVKLKINLSKGNYKVKVTEGGSILMKSLIVNK